jgi:hypothetical protein
VIESLTGDGRNRGPDYKQTNFHFAQLLGVLHGADGLDSLDKEQLLLTQKGRDGAAIVYALADIKGVRRDQIFTKNTLAASMALSRIWVE